MLVCDFEQNSNDQEIHTNSNANYPKFAEFKTRVFKKLDSKCL